MKRFLIVLVMILAGNLASAGNYFGVRLDANITVQNIGLSTPAVLALPSVGVHFGYDDPIGLGVRGSFSSLFLILNRVAVDAYFKLPVSLDGSSIYAGVGGGAIFVVLGVTGGVLEAHGLIGYEFPLAWGTSVFFEGQPVVVFPASGPVLGMVVLSGGVNFRF